MIVAELIRENDSLNEGRKKINEAIKQSERAEIKSEEAISIAKTKGDTAISIANQALVKSENTQSQLDQIVIEGDSSVEAAQARVDADGNVFTTLKERLDTKETQFANEIGILNRKTDWVDVRDFGADPSGNNDSSDAIQSAIDLAYTTSKRVIIPSGIYLITRPIKMKSEVTLEGIGSVTINAGLNVWTENHTMLELFNVNGAKVKNITWNQNGSLRDLTNVISHTIFLSNASDNIFEDITLLDAGLDPNTTGIRPSGAPLQIVSKDVEDDMYEGIIGGCYRNKFIRVKIIQNGTAVSQFGTRVLTNWDKKRPLSDFQNLSAYNVFENCEWNGQFEWNHLEFAGGGTVKNLVNNCKFKGKAITAIDFDKGASFNTACYNIVEDTGKPDVYIGDSNTRLSILHSHGVSADYKNTGNIFAYNRIIGAYSVGTTDPYESGIAVTYSNDIKIIGNYIENINEGQIGCGIMIDREIENVIIEKNTCKKVFNGIRTNTNGSNLNGVSIINNDIDAVSHGIAFTASTPLSCVGLSIKGNKVVNQQNEGIVVNSYAIAPIISENTIKSTTDSIKTSALNARIVSNTIQSNATYAFRIEEDCILVANVITGTIYQPTIVTSGKTVKSSLNSWE